MYNALKRRKSNNLTVKDVIAELEKENPDAEFTCCGDNYVTIHVEDDQSVVTVDCEDLDEAYDFDKEGMTDKWYNIPCIAGTKSWIKRERMHRLILQLLNECCTNKTHSEKYIFLEGLGCSKEEINAIMQNDFSE